MPRLGRRSAGEQVLARAGRLSDDLLAAEETCFAEIEMAFGSGAATADTLIRNRWRALKDDPKTAGADAVLRARLGALHVQALVDSRAAVAGLASLSVAWSLEAIEEELVICESTLGKKYAGVAVEGVENVRVRTDDLVTEAMAGHMQAEAYGLAAFTGLVVQQGSLVGSDAETVDDMVARLLSPVVVRKRGIGGRGVWWRTCSGLNASARNVSIGLSNAVRNAAMAGMNVAGGRR